MLVDSVGYIIATGGVEQSGKIADQRRAIARAVGEGQHGTQRRALHANFEVIQVRHGCSGRGLPASQSDTLRADKPEVKALLSVVLGLARDQQSVGGEILQMLVNGVGHILATGGLEQSGKIADQRRAIACAVGQGQHRTKRRALHANFEMMQVRHGCSGRGLPASQWAGFRFGTDPARDRRRYGSEVEQFAGE